MGHRDYQHPHQGHHSQPVVAGHLGRSGQIEAFGRVQDPKRYGGGLVGQTDASDRRHPQRQGGHADPLPVGHPEHGGEWECEGGVFGGGELINRNGNPLL